MNLDRSKIRFQAVHRIGKQKGNKNRPIIARFKDAYVSADYASYSGRAKKADQRDVMRLGKRSRSKSSRSMANIGEEKYNSENIPRN